MPPTVVLSDAHIQSIWDMHSAVDYVHHAMHGHASLLYAHQDHWKSLIMCMQLFTRRAARLLYKNQRIKRWCFDVELIYLAQQLRIPIAEVPVEWREVPGTAHG